MDAGKYLQEILTWLDESLDYLLQSDTAWSRKYTFLLRQRKVIVKAIRKANKNEKRFAKYENRHSQS